MDDSDSSSDGGPVVAVRLQAGRKGVPRTRGKKAVPQEHKTIDSEEEEEEEADDASVFEPEKESKEAGNDQQPFVESDDSSVSVVASKTKQKPSDTAVEEEGKEEDPNRPRKRGRPRKGEPPRPPKKYQKKEKKPKGLKKSSMEELLSRSKYNHFKTSWYENPSSEAAREFYHSQMSNEESFNEIIHPYEDMLRNIQCTLLKDWLTSRGITTEGFKSLLINEDPAECKTANEIFEVELSPFTAKVVAAADGNNIENLEFYCNTSSPIWQILFSPQTSLLRFADGSQMISMNLIVGLTRIGWPLKNNDYELRQNGTIKAAILPPNQKQQNKSTDPDMYLLHDNSDFILSEKDPNSSFQKTCGIGNDYTRFVGQKETHDNLIPVWSIHHKIPKLPTNNNHNNSPSAPVYQVSYFIGLNSKGSVVQMAWNKKFPTSNLILGVLAVVYGNGTCDILIVPQYLSLFSKQKDVSTSSSSTVSFDSFEKIPVIEDYHLQICTITHSSQMITSISWNPNNAFELSCGMSDGSILLFDTGDSFQNSKLASSF
jgi:hypothetical protein